MLRRRTILSLFASIAGVGSAHAEGNAGPKPRVVFHLSDPGKVTFVMSNIRNHFEGMGGAEKVEIALVIHGPSLRSLRADTPNQNIRDAWSDLRHRGLSCFACKHTMDGMGVTLTDLLPGFIVAEAGGVVKIHELQMQGYAYIRP